MGESATSESTRFWDKWVGRGDDSQSHERESIEQPILSRDFQLLVSMMHAYDWFRKQKVLRPVSQAR